MGKIEFHTCQTDLRLFSQYIFGRETIHILFELLKAAFSLTQGFLKKKEEISEVKSSLFCQNFKILPRTSFDLNDLKIALPII